MNSHCENCEFLLQQEAERIQWCKELTFKNINLHKKLNEQEEIIKILKSRLAQKQHHFMSDYVEVSIQDFNELAKNQKISADKALEKSLKSKLEEVTQLLNVINREREAYQEEMENNEKYFSDNVSYLHGLVDYFRDSLFTELEKSNTLKQYFTRKLSSLATSSQYIVLNTLKEQEEILNNELRSRYRRTIQKSKEEIERQSQLVSKLRNHNKQLYIQIQKNRVDNESKIVNLEKKLEDLKMIITKLKEKNYYLHTQIKLEVEGCQNDIFDTRKTLRKLIKPNS